MYEDNQQPRLFLLYIIRIIRFNDYRKHSLYRNIIDEEVSRVHLM